MSLPAAFAASALYDRLLQAALQRFFSRAVFETESVASESSHGRLAMEPTSDPAALALRWFGTRHTLRVPEGIPFTRHEVRLARAIGAVLSARYRAMFEPRLMAARSDLFQGAIEDRYIGAFLDERAYTAEGEQSRADRIAASIEVLRVAALSSYENRAISSGLLLLEGDEDPCGRRRPDGHGVPYTQALTGVKSFYRLGDGVRTVFMASRTGELIDIVDIRRWAAEMCSGAESQVPCAEMYRAHAMATRGNRHVCVVLSPSHEIKVFAEGAQLFNFRNADWHLLDLEAKYERWAGAVGEPALAGRLFQTALDLSEARQGALFVVLRDAESAVPQLVHPGDLLDASPRSAAPSGPLSRSDLSYLLATRTVARLDGSVLAALATMDGATVTDRAGRIIAVGAILRHPVPPAGARQPSTEGARTTAALGASQFGPVLKVSEDGLISFFDRDRIWDI
jgi:hypothetical protein